MLSLRRALLSVGVLMFALTGCTPTIPMDALELTEDSFALRQLQTRRYDTADEAKLLSAGAAVLQDLGFSLDESETALGVIVGSKDRDARQVGQIVGAIVLGALTGHSSPVDHMQKIRASLVSRPLDSSRIAVRITFQRVVWNNLNQVSRSESIEEAEIYQQFFDKLSKSVFLEAHNL